MDARGLAVQPIWMEAESDGADDATDAVEHAAAGEDGRLTASSRNGARSSARLAFAVTVHQAKLLMDVASAQEVFARRLTV